MQQHAKKCILHKIYIYMSADLLHDFKEILAPYVKEKDLLNAITQDTHLSDDLHINSSNVVDIVLDAETKYDIVFEDDDFEKLGTVGSCIQIVQQILARK